MGGQTFNRSGANLKGDAGLLDGGLSVPTQSGVANFARRTGQVSADLWEARSGRLVDKGLIVLSWTRTCVVDGVEVRMICSARPQHNDSSSFELGMLTGRDR